MSTTARSIRLALRIRVSMSAIGSVIMALFSPARFLHTRNQAIAGQAAETDTTDAKFAVNCPRTSADLAAETDADPLAGGHLNFIGRPLAGFQLRQLLAESDILGFGCHCVTRHLG